jgi:hypothetical protein
MVRKGSEAELEVSTKPSQERPLSPLSPRAPTPSVKSRGDSVWGGSRAILRILFTEGRGVRLTGEVPGGEGRGEDRHFPGLFWDLRRSMESERPTHGVARLLPHTAFPPTRDQLLRFWLVSRCHLCCPARQNRAAPDAAQRSFAEWSSLDVEIVRPSADSCERSNDACEAGFISL